MEGASAELKGTSREGVVGALMSAAVGLTENESLLDIPRTEKGQRYATARASQYTPELDCTTTLEYDCKYQARKCILGGEHTCTTSSRDAMGKVKPHLDKPSGGGW